MSSFDPTTVRKAVTEFAPPRPERFQELAGAKDFVRELRQKRASYRSIADLLTRHGLPICKSAVAAFCHEVLGETVRPFKHRPRKRPPISDSPSNQSANAAQPAVVVPQTAPEGDIPRRVRGPRIAQIRMVKPQTT